MMSTYLIGDIHGCYKELIALLNKIKFSPDKDTLWLTGDIVSRGPGSLEVLYYIKSLGKSARLVLGNHDLHLISIYVGINKDNSRDCLTSVLKAPDSEKLLHWLRFQPFLQIDRKKKIVMTHAGITPQWDLKTAEKCAYDVENVLQSDSYHLFLEKIYNYYGTSTSWNKKLKKEERFQFIINAFTKMRYCFPDGTLDMCFKDSPEKVPYPLKPWFSIRGPVIREYNIVFGHWASLEGKSGVDNVYALDTGCCWGKKLICLRWEDKSYFVQNPISTSQK